jgi:aminopeptidase N
MGPYKVHQESRKVQDGSLPVEFFSISAIPIKEDFILAEMGNAISYMNVLFGKYPYPEFRAAFHPFGFGQGFATMLAIPDADVANKRTFVFLSHEAAHQWWGNIVAWRSYRDQWLSEGFAEYSGLLYMTERTKSQGNLKELLSIMRDTVKMPPRTTTGLGSNRVTDIGPIILGLRLFSRESLNAYTILTYNKGALVLRMLHFLLSDPGSGAGDAFFKMMEDFVARYRDKAATTEGFIQVANEHFAKSPIARRYGMQDLNWFFRQWVWQTPLPSYRLEYAIESQPDGKVAVKGTLFQDNAPPEWVMPIPLVFKFSGDRVARGSVLAQGPQQPININLPMKPDSVELDPDMWVLSEKTSTKKK